MDVQENIYYQIELHSVEGIRYYFEHGGNPNEVIDGVPLFTTMVEMYYRSPKFKECVRAFVDFGLEFEDKALLAVFLDDASTLESLVKNNASILSKTYSLYNNTFTPLTGGTLLHFCAEYNHVACAWVLVRYGADVNARSAMDEYGFGGHTPVFHTVNQNQNNSEAMLQFLLKHGADLSIMVRGLIWGKGYEWETFIPVVNPVSYAMMGLLPQMHRKEAHIAATVSLLVKQAYGIDYMPPNVPNKYLHH